MMRNVAIIPTFRAYGYGNGVVTSAVLRADNTGPIRWVMRRRSQTRDTPEPNALPATADDHVALTGNLLDSLYGGHGLTLRSRYAAPICAMVDAAVFELGSTSTATPRDVQPPFVVDGGPAEPTIPAVREFISKPIMRPSVRRAAGRPSLVARSQPIRLPSSSLRFPC